MSLPACVRGCELQPLVPPRSTYIGTFYDVRRHSKTAVAYNATRTYVAVASHAQTRRTLTLDNYCVPAASQPPTDGTQGEGNEDMNKITLTQVGGAEGGRAEERTLRASRTTAARYAVSIATSSPSTRREAPRKSPKRKTPHSVPMSGKA